MNKYYHPDTDFIRKLGGALPTVQTHGTEEDITKSLTPLKPHSWRLEGNQLIGQTEMGELRQTIPTDYICRGTNDQGLPILEKISLSTDSQTPSGFLDLTKTPNSSFL